MLTRMFPLFALVLIPAVATVDEIKQAAPTPPTIVIRLASLDNLLDQLKLVGGFLGKDNFGNKLDESIKKKLGPKGLSGIDGKRPIGLYANIGADISDISGVLMVPITGAKPFKETLEGLGWEVKGDSAGLFSVKQNLLPFDLQYRIANDYAYVGLLGQNMLAPTALLAPKVVFGAKQASTPAIALTVQLGQIPEGLRGMFIEVFKEGLTKFDDKPGETKAQKALRVALGAEITRMLDGLLKDGDELGAQIDIEPKTKQLTVDLTLSGKARSKLAERIASLGQRKTLFAGVLEKDAAMNGLINFEVPAEVRKALSGVLQESLDKLLADMTDDAKKKQASDLVSALQPTFGGDDVDAAFSIRGPSANNHFTLVAGFKLKEGLKLAATLIELSKTLPANDQKAIHLNAEKAGDVAIHRIDLESALDGVAKEMFGEHPLFVAFRDDAVFLTVGEEGLPAIKKALVGPATVAPPLQFDMSLARFAAFGERDATKIKAAQALVPAGDDGRLRISLEGGPALRIRFAMALSAFSRGSKERALPRQD